MSTNTISILTVNDEASRSIAAVHRVLLATTSSHIPVAATPLPANELLQSSNCQQISPRLLMQIRPPSSRLRANHRTTEQQTPSGKQLLPRAVWLRPRALFLRLAATATMPRHTGAAAPASSPPASLPRLHPRLAYATAARHRPTPSAAPLPLALRICSSSRGGVPPRVIVVHQAPPAPPPRLAGVVAPHASPLALSRAPSPVRHPSTDPAPSHAPPASPLRACADPLSFARHRLRAVQLRPRRRSPRSSSEQQPPSTAVPSRLPSRPLLRSCPDVYGLASPLSSIVCSAAARLPRYPSREQPRPSPPRSSDALLPLDVGAAQPVQLHLAGSAASYIPPPRPCERHPPPQPLLALQAGSLMTTAAVPPRPRLCPTRPSCLTHLPCIQPPSPFPLHSPPHHDLAHVDAHRGLRRPSVDLALSWSFHSPHAHHQPPLPRSTFTTIASPSPSPTAPTSCPI